MINGLISLVILNLIYRTVINHVQHDSVRMRIVK